MSTRQEVRATGSLAGFAVLWTVGFMLTTAALQVVPAASIVALELVFGAAFLWVVFAGLPADISFVKRDWRPLAGAAALLWLALSLSVWRRYTANPPGSDTVFILSLAPVFVMWLARRYLGELIGPARLVGAAVGVLGMAAILANWERPSTFSPFVRFPSQELWLLGAAVAWAAFAVALRRLVKRDEARDPAVIVAVIVSLAALPALVVALVSPGPTALFQGIVPNITLLVALGLAGIGMPYALLTRLLATREASATAGALFATPVLMTLTVIIDAYQGVRPKVPMVMTPMTVGCLLAVLAIYLVWRGDRDLELNGVANAGRRLVLTEFSGRVLRFLAGASLLVALLAFYLPVASNLITGTQDNGRPFEAMWLTRGFQTVGGYLLLLAAGLLVYLFSRIAERGWEGARAAVVTGWAAVVLGLIAGWWFAGASSFSAWQSWVPAEIQHALGSEYATFIETPLTNVPALVSAVMMALGALTMLAMGLPGALVGSGGAGVTKTDTGDTDGQE